MSMEVFYIIIAIVCGIVGVLGSILPAMPGPPFSYIGLLVLLLCDGADISAASLWITGIFLIIVSVIDYVAPVWLTNVSGGSKQATWGSVIGLIVGLLSFTFLGIFICTFLGAFVGELVAKSTVRKSLKVALMSFVGFIMTTGIKIVYGGILLFMILWEAIPLIIKMV
jgi:uncharacterized protein YqgC (DUF456 family)